MLFSPKSLKRDFLFELHCALGSPKRQGFLGGQRLEPASGQEVAGWFLSPGSFLNDAGLAKFQGWDSSGEGWWWGGRALKSGW